MFMIMTQLKLITMHIAPINISIDCTEFKIGINIDNSIFFLSFCLIVLKEDNRCKM